MIFQFGGVTAPFSGNIGVQIEESALIIFQQKLESFSEFPFAAAIGKAFHAVTNLGEGDGGKIAFASPFI